MARKKPVKRAKKQIKGRQKRSVFAYPLVIFLLLCAGIFLIAWTFKAGADNIFVTARVSSPPVTQPAAFDSPSNGTHFTSIPISVSGTCPANGGYVEIFDNNAMRGTAICQLDGSFGLEVDLFPGANSLTAHVFNTTDDEGPVSAAVNVVYDVPQAPSATGQNNQEKKPAGAAVAPISLNTAFIYKGYRIGDQVEWPISLSGGSQPYAVSVDWGDGTSDLISRPQAGEFKIDHIYSSKGGPKNSFTIKVKATDREASTAFIQFFVIVTPKNIGQAGNIYSKPNPSIGSGINWLWVAWPLYLLILLMAVSYRLGEKEELMVLRKKGMLGR